MTVDYLGTKLLTSIIFLSSVAFYSFLGFSYFVNLFPHISDLIGLENYNIYLSKHIVYNQISAWRIQINHIFVFT